VAEADFRREVTPLVLTFNEEENIERTLSRLRWASQVLVVDSGSSDGTLAIVSRFENITVVQHPFESFADQCNFGLSQIRTPWVLSLDADHVLSEALVSELAGIVPGSSTVGFEARFVYLAQGATVRGSLYPPRVSLHRVEGSRYEDVGHGHRVVCPAGEIRRLRSVIYHDDRKPLARWVSSQVTYAEKEADFLLGADRRELKRVDRLRRTAWILPLVILPYMLFVRGTIFGGKGSWIYALQRTFAEILIALKVLERRWRGPEDSSS
jgi:glycosyltransferase involved in cell wall biosynthesis